MKKRMNVSIMIMIVWLLSFSMTINSFAGSGWEQNKYGEWQYRNENGDIEKDKWLLDNGKWYYVGMDGVMYKNQWLKSLDGEKIAWFVADGSLGYLAHSTKQHGPGIALNRYLYSEDKDFEGEKVRLNNNFLTGLSDKERRLFDYILEYYKVDDKVDGEFGQNIFIVLSADELAEILDLEMIEQENKHWVSLTEVNEVIRKIDMEVKKEINLNFLIGHRNYGVSPSDNIAESVYLVINKYVLTRITSIKHLHELINNTLVRKLEIEDGVTSQKEAARRIYHWMCSAFEYNLEMKDADLFSCWLLREGICWHFAGLYKKMCNMCGIQCDIEGGSDYLGGSGYGHVWNSTVIDGIQSFTDTTWGISSNSQAEEFFMMDRIALVNSHLRFVFVK